MPVLQSSGPMSTSVTFSITINAPLLTIPAQTPPDGNVGVNYSYQIIVSGGTAPYVFSLASGSTLPAGLSLSATGVISGTPTAQGPASFTVNVHDSSV